MLTVLSVLTSGGIYDASWVRKLRDAVARSLAVPHRFACLSDQHGVECERIPLLHRWPGWWSKLEAFRPGVITGPTLYLDLDTVLVGSIDALVGIPCEFAMMRNFHRPEMPGSSVMWFAQEPPAEVYAIFAERPDYHIAHHNEHRAGPYLGDQAFIWEALRREVDFIDDHIPAGLVRSYKKHCRAGLPAGTAVVAFGGPFKPSNVADPWVRHAWT